MTWDRLPLTQAVAACLAETRAFLTEHGASLADVFHSRRLAFAAGYARRAVYAVFSGYEAPRVESWVAARVCELYNGQARLPTYRWGAGSLTAGGQAPLPLDGFELHLSSDGWHPDRARVWLREVLDAAQAEATAKVADRAARLAAAVGQALAEANDRWRWRLLDQLAETHALHGDPVGRERLAVWLAAESDAIRDCIRQLDAVVVRIRQSLLEVSG